MLFKIDELSETALQTAIKEECETEWDGESVEKEAVLDFSRICNTLYDLNGHFVQYGNNV